MTQTNWKTGTVEAGTADVVYDEHGTVADCSLPGGIESLANARLISAAPELLRMAKWAYYVLGGADIHVPEGKRKLMDVIRKAQGKSIEDIPSVNSVEELAIARSIKKGAK